MLKIYFALPNATPADAIEVRLVNQTADAERAARFIFVNIIQRESRIEAIPPAETYAVAQASGHSQSRACHGKFHSARRLQPLVFIPCIASLICVQKRRLTHLV